MGSNPGCDHGACILDQDAFTIIASLDPPRSKWVHVSWLLFD